VKRWRYKILAGGLLLHLGIEYAMNIALFEWVMIALYITFLDPADVEKFLKFAGFSKRD